MEGYHIAAIALGLATIAIAASQKQIAETQARIAQNKLKLDLYDRRYAIFKKAAEYILTIMYHHRDNDRTILTNASNEFALVIVEARFLFGSEVNAALDEIVKMEVELYLLEAESTGLSAGNRTLAEIAARSAVRTQKLRDIQNRLILIFEPYLSFSRVSVTRETDVDSKQASSTSMVES